MCRWFIYYGNDIIFEDILYKHNNSIIKQSYLKKYTPFLEESNYRDHEINVDGFGIGWYVEDNKVPCLYTSIKTPWSDFNFRRLSKILKSKLIFAHIRAIKPFSSGLIHEFNCHPFLYKNLLFMHNGDLKDFRSYIKKVINKIDDNILSNLKGNTDSEYIFLLIISFLKNSRINIKNIKNAILEVINFIKTITTQVFSFNIAITNGKFIIFTRYISNDEKPPSLYYKFFDTNLCISSEPIDIDDEWIYIPKNVIGYYEGKEVNFEKL